MFVAHHIILAEMVIKRQVDSARRNVHEKAGSQIGNELFIEAQYKKNFIQD